MSNLSHDNSFAVLLTVYNGAKFLNEQIDSILSQKMVDVHIFVSIDKSTDNSLQIVKSYMKSFSNITLLPYGEVYGSAAKNFFRLILEADVSSNFQYIALSDQDDIWAEEKLYRAASIMRERDCSGYSSNLNAFWPDGQQELIVKNRNATSLDFLYESASAGCTFCLSFTLYDGFKSFLASCSERDYISSHDWLIYAYSRSNGERWFCDDRAMIFYRQHANNVVGANIGLFAKLKRITCLLFGWYRYDQSIIAKYFGYGESRFERLSRGVGAFRRNPAESFVIFF
jgi:rhamnosyltransferase